MIDIFGLPRGDTVLKIFEDAKAPQPPATLFLRLHYPFFDDRGVQNVLMERHPDKCRIKSGVPSWYSVEAYLIAEQYAWAYYTDDGLNNLDMIEGAAQYCFIFDLPWFARLLVAITGAIEKAAAVSPATVTLKLQRWNNQFSQADKTPGRWLAGTEELEKKKKFLKARSIPLEYWPTKKILNEEKIFQCWLPSAGKQSLLT